MTDVDRLLREAGARWRDAQPSAPTFPLGDLLADRPRAGWPATAGSPVAALVAAVVVLALIGGLVVGRLLAFGSVGGPDHSAPAPAIAASPPAPATPSSRPTATAGPHASVACDITVPDPAFVPPKPFLRVPPAYYETAWYGTAHLFTMLDRTPTPRGPWLYSQPPLPDKTFWLSVDWVVRDELEPAITVSGRRLDGPGSFRYGDPGTNATADFGTAMLVGIDYPSVGCWELTARYRDASLSYVVLVTD